MRTAVCGCIAFAAIVGCGSEADKGPFGAHNDVKLLEPFQGEWTVDEDRTFDVWRRQGKGEMVKEHKAMRERYAQAKEKSTADLRRLIDTPQVEAEMKRLHADLSVFGDTFLGRGMLRQEYRLFAIHQHSGVVCAKAWHHADRHDPGNMSKCWVRLERVGDEFHFHIKWQDDSADIEKDPDLTQVPTVVDAKSCEVAADNLDSKEWTTYVFVRPTHKQP